MVKQDLSFRIENKLFLKYQVVQFLLFKRVKNTYFKKVIYGLFGQTSVRSYKIGVVGNNWLVGWLVGDAVFSETALRMFLNFCMKLESHRAGFLKKILDFVIFTKGIPC